MPPTSKFCKIRGIRCPPSSVSISRSELEPFSISLSCAFVGSGAGATLDFWTLGPDAGPAPRPLRWKNFESELTVGVRDSPFVGLAAGTARAAVGMALEPLGGASLLESTTAATLFLVPISRFLLSSVEVPREVGPPLFGSKGVAKARGPGSLLPKVRVLSI